MFLIKVGENAQLLCAADISTNFYKSDKIISIKKKQQPKNKSEIFFNFLKRSKILCNKNYLFVTKYF